MGQGHEYSSRMADTGDTNPFVSMAELAGRIRRREVSSVDAVEAYLEVIERRDDEIQAYVTVIEEEARAAAREADETLASGDPLGPLHGVPIALKDLREFKEGVRHTFGSKPIADMGYVAERTNAPVRRLEEAGAIVLGKTNIPEFGHKGITQNEIVGATASPVDTDYNAGGSSGGSAAAVGAGMAAAATGSDSGGSIRIPAAACGIYGLKPSFGLVPVDSRPNAFDLHQHHSVQGPLTRTVEDAALMMDVLSGQHSADPATVPVDIDHRGALDRGVEGVSVGYSRTLELFDVDDEVEAVVREAADALAAAGATVEDVTLDHDLSMDELADAVGTTFATSFLGTAEAIEESFGFDLRERTDVSDSLQELLSVGDEKSARDVAATGIPRTELYDAVEEVFGEYDLLVTPLLTSRVMKLHAESKTDWNRAMAWPFNVTGHPAASVPAGLTEDGLPVGTQVVGRRYADDDVLAASAAVERERPWDSFYDQ